MKNRYGKKRERDWSKRKKEKKLRRQKFFGG